MAHGAPVFDTAARERFYASIREAMAEGRVFNGVSLSKTFGIGEESAQHLFAEFQKRADGAWVRARRQYLDQQQQRVAKTQKDVL